MALLPTPPSSTPAQPTATDSRQAPKQTQGNTGDRLNIQHSEPMTIFSLPRELRQQVLHSSFDVEIFPLSRRYELRFKAWKNEGKDLRRWIRLLENVHPGLAEDVEFVAGQWTKEFKKLKPHEGKGPWY